MKQIHEYPSMLEVMEGLMGAGKSYWAVRRMILTLEEQARPVYTNLPLKHEVLRKYLRDRHGEVMANLVHPLSEEHWRRFLRRQHKFSEFKTRVDAMRPCDLTDEDHQQIYQACQESYSEHPPTLSQIKCSQRFYINWIIAWFDSQYGKPVDTGPDANHIPPASIIIIDELQRWHPMMKQSADPDREHLLSYITMSRHHAHWIWVLTQDAMNISIEFRRLAHQLWIIWNRSEDEIYGPIRFKHLTFGPFKLRVMGYARFTHEDYEKYKSSNTTEKRGIAVEAFSIITNFPRSKLFYRFYSSETHLGSRRQLQKKLREGQKQAGVDPDSHKLVEEVKETFMGKVFRMLYFAIAMLVLIVGAFIAGNQYADPPQNKEQKSEVIQWPQWTMVSATPWIGGKPTRLEEQIGNTRAKLRFISEDRRSLVLVHDDAYWLWNFGAEPILVGAIEDVRTAVAGIQGAESAGHGSTQ
jgi:Zonular occludens toxin (Zot)